MRGESEVIREGIKDRSERESFKDKKALLAALSSFYRRMVKEQAEKGSLYLPQGEWDIYLGERKEFYASLAEKDLRQVHRKLRNFWRNELGPIVSNYAYYGDLEKGSKAKTRRFLSNMARDVGTWRSLFPHEDFSTLSVPRTGNPWGFPTEEGLVVPQGLRYYCHARQISNLLSGVNAPVWAEIGGGYCGTAFYYFRNRHRPRVTYVNLDLPETLVLAAYYLKSSLPGKKIYLYRGGERLDRKFMKKYDILLMPNYAVTELEEESVDLFLNAFSLSEMTYPVLRNYIRRIETSLRGYFLHNNVDKGGVVNRGFERIPASSYPLNRRLMKLIYMKHDTFQGIGGDYREFLYEKRSG